MSKILNPVTDHTAPEPSRPVLEAVRIGRSLMNFRLIFWSRRRSFERSLPLAKVPVPIRGETNSLEALTARLVGKAHHRPPLSSPYLSNNLNSR